MIRYKAVRRFGRIGLVLFLAIGLLGIAACDDSRGDRPIAIYGDSQRNENIQAKVV